MEPGDTSMQEARVKLVEAAINQLPAHAKRIFQLIKFDGLSYEEAAERLSISKNTVKTQMLRSTSFIRDYVQRSPGNDITFATLLLLDYILAPSS